MVRPPGQVMVGGVASITSIGVDQEVVPPAAETVIVRSSEDEMKVPGAGVCTKDMGEQSLTFNWFLRSGIRTSQSSPRSSTNGPAGALMMTGGESSMTFTVKEQVAVFSEASTALYVIMVDPIGKAELLAGPAMRVMLTVPPQLSMAVGTANWTVAVQPAPAATVMSAGQMIAGATVSATVTVCTAEWIIPQAPWSSSTRH